MCNSLFIKLFIIIMMTNISNTNLDFTKDYLKNIDIGNIQIVNNSNINADTSYNYYEKQEVNNSTIYPHTSDSWGDISNNSYDAIYYRENVDKDNVPDIENLNKYTKKVWVNDSNEDIEFNLIITDIKDNIISVKIQIGGKVSLYSYSRDVLGSFYSAEEFMGIVNNKGAECRCEYDNGKIELVFIDDSTIKLNVDVINSEEYGKITNKTYYLKPYYRKLKDIGFTEEKYYTVNLNSWGIVNITTGYILGSHPNAVAYITNSNREILYEFGYCINGMKIENVVVEDINNDGLNDVILLFDICKDEPRKYYFIQMKNGMFIQKGWS